MTLIYKKIVRIAVCHIKEIMQHQNRNISESLNHKKKLSAEHTARKAFKFFIHGTHIKV